MDLDSLLHCPECATQNIETLDVTAAGVQAVEEYWHRREIEIRKALQKKTKDVRSHSYPSSKAFGNCRMSNCVH